MSARAAGRQVVVIVREFAPDQPLYLYLTEGDPEGIRDALARGEVVSTAGASPDEIIMRSPGSLKIAQAGKPLLLEKPMTGTLAEARALADAGLGLRNHQHGVNHFQKPVTFLNGVGRHIFIVR